MDIILDLASTIATAKTFGASENIRHGRYIFVIRRIFADQVETNQGKARMVFWEMSPIKSENNPQTEGDHTDYPLATGPLRDDGTRPNLVGSQCALKVNFDGKGARSAPANAKAPILALFGKREGEISDKEVGDTWTDLSRQKPEGNKGANPACGMLIACTTMVKKKKEASTEGAYVTKLIWSCVSPPGTGENAPEKVAARRAEIEKTLAAEEHAEAAVAPPLSVPGGFVPPPPPAPPAPVVAASSFPPAGWLAHPSAPGFFYLGSEVMHESQLRAKFASNGV